MGGPGSGRHYHFSAKSLTDEYRALDVRRWAREGYLEPGRAFGWRWTCEGETTGSIRVYAERGAVRLVYRSRIYGDDWRDHDYRVWLDRTPCHFGGARVWFRCPARGCGRRVALLYGGTVYACRHCHDLAYPVQREDTWQRHTRRAEKLLERLDWDDAGEEWVKPKGMHWRTFNRICAEADAADAASFGALMTRFGDAIPTLDLLAERLDAVHHHDRKGG